MTLKEFTENLEKFIEENPEILNMQVVTSSDDEGNSFNLVYYPPSKGIFEDREFTPFSQYADYNRDKDETNSVCIN